MRFNSILLSCLLLIAFSSTDAVEFLVTDTNGNTLNTTNKLDLGSSSPSPKTIQLWLTYTDAERTTTNNGGGLFQGAVIATPANAQVANFLPPGTSAVTNPGGQWNPISIQFNSLTTPTILGVSFSRGSQAGIVLPPTSGGTGKVLLLEYLVSPGPQISSTGTDIVFNVNNSYGLFGYGTSTASIIYNPQPQAYTISVVPEPTTYALGAVATAMLGGVGFYRRKKAVKSL